MRSPLGGHRRAWLHPRIPSGLRIDTKGVEITIGFHEWHTHGAMLGGPSSDEQVAAALEFVRRILDDELQLVISSVGGAFRDAWVTEDPAKDVRYSEPNEELLIGETGT